MNLSRREALSLSGSVVAAAGLSTGAPAAPRGAGAGTKWWMDEPIRMALVLYDQTRPPLDTDAFVQWLDDLGANAVYLPAGGVASYYTSKVPFHVRASGVPAGRDLIGEITRKAHARNIKVVARFEWTVHQDPDVLKAHPDWAQRNAAGESPVWRDVYLMCVNGGYIREQARKILDEALTRYPLDGIFFNWSGQRMNNGLCHCVNCQRLFRAKYDRDLPTTPDKDYVEFISASVDEAYGGLVDFVRAKRPDNGFNVLIGEQADSYNGETHSAPIGTSTAYWPYQATETVNRLRSSQPDKMSFNNDAVFIDGYWRYAHRSAPDGEVRAYQNMANGAGPFLFVNGPIEQFDPEGERGARPAFQFHKANQQLYVRQENAARVLLLDDEEGGFHFRYGPAPAGVRAGNGGFGYLETDGAGGPGGAGDVTRTSLRGFIRLLSEQHIPFALTRNLDWIDKEPQKYDLVISPRGAPRALDGWLRRGGKLLVAGAQKPELDLPPVVREWKRQETLSSYWRLQDPALLPSLAKTELIFNYSDFLELQPQGKSALTFVPGTPTIPMENVGRGMAVTNKPGLHLADYGSGRLAYLPWDIGDLYYRAGAVQHSALVGDLIDHLLRGNRQIRTNAHPMVQITVQRQAKEKRDLVHFVNMSGLSQVSYHQAIPMSGIQVEVLGEYRSARLVSQGRTLPIRRAGEYTSLTLPSLDTYDVVVLT